MDTHFNMLYWRLLVLSAVKWMENVAWFHIISPIKKSEKCNMHLISVPFCFDTSKYNPVQPAAFRNDLTGYSNCLI